LTTFNQTAIPNRGELVSVDIDRYNLDDDYACKTVSFTFQAGWVNTPFMDVELGKSRDDLVEWLAILRMDLDRLKIGASGVEEGLVNEIITVDPDSVTVTDDCSITVVTSGDFVYDTARYDFSDYG